MTGKEVLRALADGADVSEFEVYSPSIDIWQSFDSKCVSLDLFTGAEKFRRKPRTRVVNGFTVPAPIQEMPKHGQLVFEANPFYEEWFDSQDYESEHPYSQRAYSRGLLFSTKEAAIANAKAMCGIDPNGEA